MAANYRRLSDGAEVEIRHFTPATWLDVVEWCGGVASVIDDCQAITWLGRKTVVELGHYVVHEDDTFRELKSYRLAEKYEPIEHTEGDPADHGS